MDIQFKLSFKNYNYEYSVNSFVRHSTKLFQSKGEAEVTLKENLETSVLFLSDDPDGRFYMDGLDTLPEYCVKEDKGGEVYLSPLDSYQTIFTFDEQEKYYPLIPGFYRIRIVVYGESYYAWVKVSTKQVTEEQWIIMRDDIEHTLQGLAQDLIRKNSSLGLDETVPIPFSYLRKYYLLKEYESRLSSIMIDLHKYPRSSILKDYEMVPRGQERDIDERTIRHLARRPEHKNFLKVPVRNVSFDLPENQYLKHILNIFIEEVQTFLVYLDSYKESVKREWRELSSYHSATHVAVITKEKVLNDLKQYEQDMKRMRGNFLWCLDAPWMKEVTSRWKGSVPSVMLLDSRYRLFHRVYRLLKKDKFDVTIDPSFSYHWKRTDSLYEIWGFLQLIKILQEIGYSPIKGWLYDEQSNSHGIMIPVLEPGTTIVFQKDQLLIRLVYDKILPYENADTTLESPIYTSDSHNRPDVRLDVNDQEGYIGSLLIDFKYRPVKNIWQHYYIRTRRQTKTMKQLDSYQSNCRSKWLLKGRYPQSLLDLMRPVREVWAVYPKNDNNSIDRSSEQYNIRLMPLTPNKDQQDFINTLSNLLDRIRKV